MNKAITIKILFVLTLSICSISFCFGAGQKNIQIIQSTKTLVAPEACAYQWYHNGTLMEGEVGQSVSVKEMGNYEVESVDEQGKVSETDITVAINAMGAIIKIILIGDSTVANAPANLYPNMGWGQVFQYYFNSANIEVRNFAKSGTSTTTFYRGYWPAAKNAIAAGDYVFMQFGHNDQKESIPTQYAAPYTTYQEYLTKYANEVRAKGAIPVFVTSVNRNLWNGTTFDAGSLGDYPDAVRKLGVKLNIPVIDLNAKSAVLFRSLGQNYLSNYVFNNYQPGEYPNYPNGNSDKTHFNEMGAIEVSRLVIDCIKELSSNASMNALASYLNPVYEVAVTANPKTAATMITRTASYPQGMNITLKTTPKAPNKFYNWNNEASKSVSTKVIYSFKMGNKATSYAAIYNNATLDISENGLEVESTVYPNPFTKEFLLAAPGSFDYTLYTMEGIEIENGKAYNSVSLGSSLNAGIYLVRISTEKGIKLSKIIKK